MSTNSSPHSRPNRTPNSPETRATAALADFLEQHPPARRDLLRALFGGTPPAGLREWRTLRVEAEAPALGRKRIDLLVESADTAVLLEMKIAAREDCAQYLSYTEELRRRKERVHVFGVLNRVAPDPLLESFTTARLSWAHLHRVLEEGAAGASPDQLRAVAELGLTWRAQGIHLGDGHARRVAGELTGGPDRPRRPARATAPEADLAALPGNARLMRRLGQEVVAGWEGPDFTWQVLKTGNTPIHLRLGWRRWTRLFRDDFHDRLIVGLNYPPKKQVAEPIFYFQTLFYNKGHSTNFPYFASPWREWAERMLRRGYRLRSDDPAHQSWNHTVTHRDIPGFTVEPRFCYAQHERFGADLAASRYLGLGWAGLVAELRQRILTLARDLDEVDRP